MAHQHTDGLYPPAEIPKRPTPWFNQLLVAFALLALAVVTYALWRIGRVPARTLELPALDQPANGPPNNPPAERPQRRTPLPTPLVPTPAPAPAAP